VKHPIIAGISAAALVISAAVVFLAAVIAEVPRAHAAPACHGRSGFASWYGPESGRVTASGALFRPDAMTAAMWGPRFGSRYRVTYRGRSVVVTITDRGPAKRLHRIIDLSRGAARRLGMRGVGRVCLERAGS
jgi:rare lipoprotein A (peptidoglycan hydrolase)